MTKYIALLRGINVGGNNIIKMSDLKSTFEKAGFANVSTYINSGNVIFESELTEAAAKKVCEKFINDCLGLNIPVCVISASDLLDAIEHAPAWWDTGADSRQNAIFVIPPATPEEIIAQIGETKPELERLDACGNVIFWTAPTATYSRSRLTKIVQSKAAYNAITIRNANTAKKLAVLAGKS